MIKKIVLYVFIFLLSLIVFLALLLPANVVWEKVLSPQFNSKQLGLDVKKVIGTIWDGQALISYKGVSGIVRWDVDAAKLLRLELPIHLYLNSQFGAAEATLSASFSTLHAEIIKAQIDLKPLTPIFRAERVSLDGELFVKNLLLVIENKQIKSATGMASWTGGNIAYPAGREVHQRNLPMFKLIVETTAAGDIQAGIRDAQAGFDVINASLTPAGEGMLKITRRLLDLSDEPWSPNSREQDIVFKVKKMLY